MKRSSGWKLSGRAVLLATLLLFVHGWRANAASVPSGMAISAGTVPPDRPDPTGDLQMIPTPLSVPGYVKPNPAGTSGSDLANAVDAVAQSASRNYFSLNYSWTLLCGFLIMFMQAGFALVETGMCRAKNAAHTMSMNFLVYALGMAGFFVCGYAFMCGGVSDPRLLGGPGVIGGLPVLDRMITIGNGWGICGYSGFFLSGRAYDASAILLFVFMMFFMDTTATIPTGALAERWRFKSFFIFSLFIGAFIYPIFAGWCWGGGWLSQLGIKAGLGHGAVDYAGSGVVHLQGGTLGLITAWMIGPRIGKYDPSGRPRPIFAHDIPMVILGTFILAFGWFGFNAGSSLAGSDGRISIVAANTMLASGAGALSSCVYVWAVYGKPDPTMMSNGMLAGLVAITAPCAFVAPWAAFVIGGIAGILVICGVFFWERIGIDDPVGAISVHGVNGAWGLLALGLFADGTYGRGMHGVGYDSYLGLAGRGVTGLFYGDARQFAAQVIDVGVCITWNVLAGGLIFLVIGKVIGGNRVPPEVEIAGLDIPEMGAPGYPEYLDAMAPEQVPASEIASARESLARR